MNLTKKSGKKAQMELLGVAVIVVFLALGIYLVVKFNITQPQSNTKASYTSSQLSSNMISSIITTTTANCTNKDMLDILIDCADYSPEGNIICIDYVGPPSHQNKSCEYFNATMNQILNNTLDAWGQNYIFNITTVSGSTIEQVWGKSRGTCTGERKTGQYFFETNVKGTMLIRLDMCS